MNRLALILCAAALAATAASPAFADTAVSNQPFSDLGGPLSIDTPIQGLYQAFDQFSFAQNTTLDRLAWTGYLAPRGYFVDAIYADAHGSPGILIYAQNAGQGNPSYLGQSFFGGSIYAYDTTIGFDAVAGVPYWLSIYAVSPIEENWDWGRSTTGANKAIEYVQQGVGQGTSQLNENLAFTLYGGPTVVPPPPPPPAVTPEPSSLVLLGSGVLTMAGMVRRRLINR